MQTLSSGPVGKQLPVYREICENIRQKIFEGSLRPGAPLPSPRFLAKQLGISRSSVIRAYELLFEEGLIRAEPRKGYFVARLPGSAVVNVPEKHPAGGGQVTPEGEVVFVPFVGPPRGKQVPYDFWPGHPDPRLFPWKRWRHALDQTLSLPNRFLFTDYAHPQGIRALREAIAIYLGAVRGVRVDPDEILITQGSQEALFLLASLLIGPGDKVAVEDPGYRGAYAAFTRSKGLVVPIPVDEQGLVVEILPPDTRLVYVTPTHQYPTGVTLSSRRRLDLLAWAEKTGAWILEDDYDGEFWYEGLPPSPLRNDGPERVIYLGTFSKILGAGLRLGFAILPPHLVAQAVALKAALSMCSPPFLQATLAELILSGSLQRHLCRLVRIYRKRRDALLRFLHLLGEGFKVGGSQGGLHLALSLPEDLPPARVLAGLLEAKGVGVYSLEEANAWGSQKARVVYERNVFLGFAPLGEEEIERAMALVVRVVAGGSKVNV